MDERQSKWLVMLSAVLALLVLGIVFVEPPGPDLEEGRRWTRAAGDRTDEAVAEVNVRLGGSWTRVVRTAGAWRWVEPVDVAGDGPRVDSLVRSMLDVELGAPVDVSPEAVGLGPESAKVELVFTDGTTVSATVGEDSPVGSSTYILDGDGAVRPTRTRLSQALPEHADSLRSRALVSFVRTDVQRLEITGLDDQPTRTVSKDRDGWWLEGTDPRVRASETHVHTVMDALRYIEAERFLDDSPALPDDSASVSVSVGTEPQTSSLRLRRTPDGVWLASGPEQPGAVVLGATDLVTQATADDSTWTESRVLVLRPTRLESLEVELDGARVSARRTPDGWSDPRLEPLLMALETGMAQRGDPTVPAPSGSPKGRIVADHGGQSASVVVYQALPSGGRVATEPGTAAPMVVQGATIDAIAAVLTKSADLP